MMKHAESFFFLLATVVALVLPAVPALQEALTADYTTVDASAPSATTKRTIANAAVDRPSSQVTAVRRASTAAL